MSRNLSFSMDGCLVATICYFGFQGFRSGFFRELYSLGRFFLSIFIGYQGRGGAASILGFSGLGGEAIGFYALFFGSYLILGMMSKLFFTDRSPDLLNGLLGGFLGTIEAVLLFGLLGILINTIPMKEAPAPGISSALGEKLNNAVLNPIIESTSGPVVMLKLAQDVKKGVDPQKVDRETIARQLAPLQSNQKIREITEDREVTRLLQEKNIQGLVGNSKVKALLSDPEIQKAAEKIDWRVIADAIRKGIPK